MKPTRNTPKGKAINNGNQDESGNTQAVKTCKPRTNAENKSHLVAHNTSPLQDRELILALIPKDTYSKGVNETIKFYALFNIPMINQTLKNGGQSKHTIEYNDNEPIEILASKYADAYINLCKCKLRLSFYKELPKKTMQVSIQPNYSHDTLSNGLFCWLTLTNIFQKYFEYETDRDVFSQFKSIKGKDDIIVKGIDPLISETIIGLKKIRDECYFSIFRMAMDPSIDLKSKFKELSNYKGFKLRESELVTLVKSCQISTTSDNSSTVEEMIDNEIRNLACYASKIQISIDCLNIIKNTPKTVNNLKIVYQILSNCFSFYKEDLAQFKEAQKQRPSKLCDDYFMIKSYLLDQIKKFAVPINQATINNTAELEGNATKQNNLPALPINQSSLNPQNKKTESDRPVKQIETEEEKNLKISDEDSIEGIERETNELMEVLRQLYDKDRKEKLERKELQLKAKSKEVAVSRAPMESLTSENVTIIVGNMEFTFQKLYHSTFSTDVWGVIITKNSVELQILARYEQLLSNATIGSGSISQLKGFSNCYEIGSSSMDSRLLGKMYNDGILSALLNFMSEEDALQLNAELEKYGINDKASLVIFSAEAKKHEEINSVARKL